MIEIIREETLKEREERRKRESNKEKQKTEEKQTESSSIPKNIRQIGDSSGIEKIYIEDYVMTHMKQLAAYGDEKPKVLILYGKREIIDSQLFWFISGAVQAEAIDSFMDKIVFDEKLWVQINETANRFFNGLAILGWAFLKKSGDSYWDEMILSTHKKFFRPDQKIFFEYIMNERIENMYLFENGKMDRQSGFYIYYDRNEAMQNYMLAYKEEETEQPEEFTGDQATKQFRAIVQEKKEQMRRRHTMGLLYGTSAILVMVIMVIGITMLNNYEKMQNMEKVLYEISGQMEEVQVVETGEGVVNLKTTDGTELTAGDDVVETTAVAITKAPDTQPDNSKDAAGNMNQNGEATANQNGAANGEAPANQNAAANEGAATNQNAAANEGAATNQNAAANEGAATNQNAAANGEATPDQNAAANEKTAANQNAGANAETQAKPDGNKNGEKADEAANTKNGEGAENAAQAEEKSGTNMENPTEASENGQAVETASATPKEYIIQKGDTLAKISRKFYGSEKMVKKICELNHIQDMDNILYGEKILLP
ncbi:MAG: LysM peptidoglycan-binding domain-containing protein [Roseburia sp.]|nr:LysM peptidoglycan-binding domain-containing protein [Roseburia sp.]MCM1280165.1 LysM peptidoglycan-binding domain-containing protein [Robinsoniella sp.]